MLVIVKNTENALLQELKACWENFPTHRCLYLKLSALQEGSQEWFSEVSEAAKSFLDDKTAQLYLCQDQDIFIVTRTITQKRANEFLAHLSHKLTPASLQGLAALFEIGVDWPKLQAVCKKKIEEIQMKIVFEKRKKQEEEARAMDFKNQTVNRIDQDLINTLFARRSIREEPLVMIVEDDLFSQRLVANVLQSRFELTMAEDGQGAIMGYVKHAPDVLFLDIGLPDIDGHAVLEKLFQIDPQAYVVMFSGNGDKENVMKAITLGAKGFVGKPFSEDKLLQYIHKSPFIQARQPKESLTHSV